MMTALLRTALAFAVGTAIACATIGHAVQLRALLLITLDTTRADRLPMYGYSSLQAPGLDRLAREGVVFDRTTSVAPLTLTAHTSLLTGLYPFHHGVRDNADRALDASTPTLATAMHEQGFHTAAFVGSVVLAPDRGLSRGFDVYDDGALAGLRAPRRRPGNEVVDHALEWLEANGRSRFFLWVHLYDAHAPQRPPDELRRAYGDSYVGGVAFEDAQIGRLLDALDREHLRETTAIVVAGDHGESLGDHGENEHGIFVYESALHVPLIISAPHVRVGRTHELTSLVDVAPTVLELFGLHPARMDGTSLAGALAGKELKDRPIYAESLYALRFGWSPLRAVRDDRYKYIEAPRPEVYDLENDPFEARDLSASRPDLLAAMRAQLVRGFGNDVSRTDTAHELSPELRARLGALGYTSGPRNPSAGAGPDPKDEIQTYNTRQGFLR